MMRYAFRGLRKNPGFTLAAVFTLALGIGANTAIFSVLNAMLLRALPYRDPQRLVMVWESNPALDSLVAERVQTCLRNFLEWRSQNHVFDDMAFFRYGGFDLTGGDKPEHAKAVLVSPGFFELLGARGMRGRAFVPEESEPGRNRVVILSHALFVRRFGADPDILGRSISMNGADYTVVGILPREFHLSSFREGGEELQSDVWAPAEINPAGKKADLELRRLYVLARLKPGVSLGQARAGMALIARRLAEKYPLLDKTWGTSVFPLSAEDLGAGMRRTLLVLECAVVFVLLIACANVVNLQLTRSAAREKEMAIRVALGAGRRRVARQMLGESLLLSALGGAAGILLAYWAISGMVALAPSDIHRLGDLRIDVPVLVFTAAITMLTGLFFGLAPSIFAARQDPNDALRRGGRWGEGSVSARIRRVLVVAEVVLSLVLLAGAGLLIRTLRAVMQLSPGFESSHLLTMQIDLRRERYPAQERGGAFAGQLLERVQHLPGVRSAAVINSLPMQSLQMAGFLVEGQSEPAPGQALVADVRAASHEYFATMGMRITAGRGFTQAETEKQSATETIVNESLARKLWPGGNALGQALRSPANFSGEAWRRVVVGVVTDTRQLGLDYPPRPEMFVPMRRIYPNFTLVVRTSGDPLRAASAVTEQVWAIDKGQPVHDVLTMEQVVNDTISQRRFNMLVLAIFAGTALALAAVGIYGVLAYSVSRRTQEIGIRMALGAQTGDVLRLIGREGFVLALCGIAIGLAGALVMTRLMSSLLFGVSPTDAVTFAAMPGLLAAVALAACWLPAHRAARVEPTVALRHE